VKRLPIPFNHSLATYRTVVVPRMHPLSQTAFTKLVVARFQPIHFHAVDVAQTHRTCVNRLVVKTQ
jgi:hypothetical protein